MKRILFLIMVYDKFPIMEEYKVILKHYLSMKEKHGLDNIEIYGYTSGKEESYDEELRLFTFNIGMPESNYATYIKTQKMFEYADKYFDFDYIYRANTSTFCNIVLLNKFVQETRIPFNTIYGAELYSKNKTKDKRLIIYYKYIRGNSILIPRALVKQIYSYDNKTIEKIRDFAELAADDDIIGLIFRKTIVKYSSYFQEWFKSTDKTDTLFGNDNISSDHLYNFIAIQYKTYLDRSTELGKLNYLCDIFDKYEYKKENLDCVYAHINGRNVIWTHPYGYVGEVDKDKYILLGLEKEKINNFILNKENEQENE